MSLFHAVVWMDHNEAHVLHFDAESIQADRVKARSHHPRHHGADERALHGFYETIIAALGGAHEVLLVGPGRAHDEFKSFVEKQHKPLLGALVGSQTVDHPSDKQSVALARQFFVKYDRMAGTPVPM